MNKHEDVDGGGRQVDYAAAQGAAHGVPVLHVRGEVDIRSGDRLRADLAELLAAAVDNVAVLDLTDVTFFDSTGLHVFDDCFAAAGERGVRIPIVCVQERVLRLFQITGLDDKYDIFDTVDAAVSTSNGAG